MAAIVGVPAFRPQDLLWYFIEVDNDDAADPVKQRGPFAMNEFRSLWQRRVVTGESYVWADGMGDFQQVKTIPSLNQALNQPQESTSAMMAGIKVNLKKASWYYKDKAGCKQGPCVFDTLKIMWDFNEVDEATWVYAEGMMDYAPIRDVPPLFKALAMGLQDNSNHAADSESEPNVGAGAAPGWTNQHPAQAPAPTIARAPAPVAAPAPTRYTPEAYAAHPPSRGQDHVAPSTSSRSVFATPFPASTMDPPATLPYAVPAASAQEGARGMDPRQRALEARWDDLSAQTRALNQSATRTSPRRSRAAADIHAGVRGELSETEFGEEGDRSPRYASGRHGSGGRVRESLTNKLVNSPLASDQRRRARGEERGARRREGGRSGAGDEEDSVSEDDAASPARTRRLKHQPTHGLPPGTQRKGEASAVAAGEANGLAPKASLFSFSSHPGSLGTALGGAAGGGMLAQIKGGMYQMLQEEISALEARLEEGKRELQVEYDTFYEDLQSKLEAQEARYRRAKTKQRNLAEEREQIRRERAELEMERAELAQSRKDLANRGNRLEAELDAARLQIEEDTQALARQRESLAAEHSGLAAKMRELQDKFGEMEKERAALDADLKEFDQYRSESEKLMETKMLILKEEREEYARNRAELEAGQRQLAEQTSERARDHEAKEVDLAQKNAVLELNTQRLAEERAEFQKHRVDTEAALAAEREKIFDHARALEGYKQLNREMLERDRKGVAEERERLAGEMEGERRLLEVQRTDHARKTVELQHQIHGASITGIGGGATTSYPNQQPPHLSSRAMQPSTGGGAFTALQPPPVSPSLEILQGLAIGQNRRQQTLVRDGLPHSSMSVRVYIGSSDERNRLGEVLIGPDTTIGELRRVVQARYNLPATYKMKKRNVPIHTGQDHHPAYDFFTSEAEDHIVVDP